MNLVKTLANNTIQVHSYCTRQPTFTKVAGYVPVVGLIPASLRLLAVVTIAIESFKYQFGIKPVFHAAIICIPRAAFEATGLGVLLLPVDLTVTAVHIVYLKLKATGPSDDEAMRDESEYRTAAPLIPDDGHLAGRKGPWDPDEDSY